MATALQRRPLRRRVQARVMNLLNIPMRRILGLPFATPLGRRLMLVHIIGRKTGRLYRQPVSYMKDGQTLLTPGGGRWKLNLHPDQQVRIRLRGQDVWATPEIISDNDAVNSDLTKMAAANPRMKSFIGIPQEPSGRFDEQRLKQAVDYGFRVVRWHLDT
jgi:deazaflavin-dependent oxidoreductase (nitroreductase family)